MKFNSSISNIEFIDEDILAVVLKNGELWYTNIVTKDKVKLYPNEKRKVKVWVIGWGGGAPRRSRFENFGMSDCM